MRADTRLKAALLGSGAAVMLLASPAVADEVGDLKAQIEALQNRLDQMEVKQDRIESEQVAPAQAVVGGDFPGSWKMPGTDTSISFSGYVKADTFFDVDADVGDSFVFSSIAIDNTAASNADGNFRSHARQSRFRFDTRTPTDFGQLQTRIEGDFFGTGGNERFSNSNSFRLRHAFGRLGPVLAGQTWSTFMDEDTFAETVDFFGPISVEFVRQAQIRYTAQLGEGLSADIAIENPEMDNATAGGGSNVGVVDQVPDGVLAVRYRAPWGAINVSGVVRQFNFDNGTVQDDAIGGAVHFGTTVKVTDNDTIRAVFNYGDGIGRYMLGAEKSVAVFCPGNPGIAVATCAQIDTQTAYGGWVGINHSWTDTLRSNAFFGFVENSVHVNELGNAGSAGRTNALKSLHANVFWSPVQRVNIGLEFIHGWRDLAVGSGGEGSGQASRIQLGFQYVF